MPNHVHLIAAPSSEAGLRLALGEAHRRYTRRINFREGWRGHSWQGRFASYVMDDYYLLAASRYVEMNPVRAHLAKRAKDWPWSSAAAHLKGRDDALVKVAPLLERVKSWARFLAEPGPEGVPARLHRHEHTGRPLGDERFVARLEKRLGRILAPQRPGRKPKKAGRKPRRAAT
jgi:putative transposase